MWRGRLDTRERKRERIYPPEFRPVGMDEPGGGWRTHLNASSKPLKRFSPLRVYLGSSESLFVRSERFSCVLTKIKKNKTAFPSTLPQTQIKYNLFKKEVSYPTPSEGEARQSRKASA